MRIVALIYILLSLSLQSFGLLHLKQIQKHDGPSKAFDIVFLFGLTCIAAGLVSFLWLARVIMSGT